MSSKIIQKPDYSNYNLEIEKLNLAEYLKSQSLMISEDFFGKIGIGDIIEVYRFPENLQIYSNSEFKRLCSYTDDQMKDNAFTKIFWRDSEVHQQLVARAIDVCSSSLGTYPWSISSHELVESLHPRKRTFNMAVKNIAPCFKVGESKSCGFVSTLQVEFIFEWSEDIA
jgi:hypothetical protein